MTFEMMKGGSFHMIGMPPNEPVASKVVQPISRKLHKYFIVRRSTFSSLVFLKNDYGGILFGDKAFDKGLLFP